MIIGRRRSLALVSGAVASGAVARTAHAQAYPTRPTRIIVPFAPGGQTDTIARVIGQKLAEHFGQPFYVDNVPGASGTIGVARAAQAPADGHTLLVVDPSFVVNPSLYKQVPYDPYNDFEPVSLAVTTTQVLTVHPSLPVQSAADLVRLVRAHAGTYSYASAGIGTPGHLAGEMFRLSLGLDLVHIPFSGAGPAITSTIGGHTPIAFGSPASTVGHVKDGKLRGLAVATARRLPALPDVPTMAEAGFPGIECDVWVGVFAPAGTPAATIAALHRAIADIVALPDVTARLTGFGFQPFAVTLEDAPARVRAEGAKWAKVIREAGIKAE